MITRRLTDFTDIEMLYSERMRRDFPGNELRPLVWIRKLWDRNAYECYAMFDKDAILGYAFFVRRDKDYLFDYFAIAEEHRNEGLGSLFLRQLEECIRDANCVVGEVEDPDRAQDEETAALRERRMQFYLRSGYRRTELTAKVFGVDFRILEVPTSVEHTEEELRTVYTELYRSILPAEFFETQFQINKLF